MNVFHPFQHALLQLLLQLFLLLLSWSSSSQSLPTIVARGALVVVDEYSRKVCIAVRLAQVAQFLARFVPSPRASCCRCGHHDVVAV